MHLGLYTLAFISLRDFKNKKRNWSWSHRSIHLATPEAVTGKKKKVHDFLGQFSETLSSKSEVEKAINIVQCSSTCLLQVKPCV